MYPIFLEKELGENLQKPLGPCASKPSKELHTLATTFWTPPTNWQQSTFAEATEQSGVSTHCLLGSSERKEPGAGLGVLCDLVPAWCQGSVPGRWAGKKGFPQAVDLLEGFPQAVDLLQRRRRRQGGGLSSPSFWQWSLVASKRGAQGPPKEAWKGAQKSRKRGFWGGGPRREASFISKALGAPKTAHFKKIANAVLEQGLAPSAKCKKVFGLTAWLPPKQQSTFWCLRRWKWWCFCNLQVTSERQQERCLQPPGYQK